MNNENPYRPKQPDNVGAEASAPREPVKCRGVRRSEPDRFGRVTPGRSRVRRSKWMERARFD